MKNRPFRILFLCTGNSARSILAEAVLNRLGAGRFEAYSAGSMPAGKVHPFTLELLQDHAYPTERLRSKSWDEFARPGAPVRRSMSLRAFSESSVPITISANCSRPPGFTTR